LNLESLSWIFGISIAVVVGGIVFLGLDLAADVLISLSGHQRALRFYRRLKPKEEEFDLDRELFGGINWPLLSLACGFMAFWLVGFLSGQVMYGIVGAAVGAALPIAVRPALRERKMWQIKVEIRDFLSALRMALAIHPTVPLALQTVSEGMGNGPFARRLQRHARTRLLTEGADRVIERLAQEFRSSELEDLLARIEAARKGGLALPEALRRASRQMEDEMVAEAEYTVEAAPVRLTFPLLVTLFPPLLLLTVVPFLVTLIEGLRSLG